MWGVLVVGVRTPKTVTSQNILKLRLGVDEGDERILMTMELLNRFGWLMCFEGSMRKS